MGKSDRTGKREAIRTAEKGKHTGKNCTSISRKADSSQNSQQRRNIRTENDEKGGTENEENNF